MEHSGSCFMSGKESVGVSTGAAPWLPVIRSTAGCLGRALSKTGGPSRSAGAQGSGLIGPTNPTLHIPLLDRSRREVTVQGLRRFPFQADDALLDA